VTLSNRQFISEVIVFANFMKTKIVREKMDIAMMSEASLSKDWMKRGKIYKLDVVSI